MKARSRNHTLLQCKARPPITAYEKSGRNVFKDIGVPNADEHLVKAQLVFKIDTIMKKRRLKQVEAAHLFGVRQPDISKMLRGEFRQFSAERLLRFLVALGQNVETHGQARDTCQHDRGAES